MDMPIFCGHLLPPNDEDFSLPGSITQIRSAEKTVTCALPGALKKAPSSEGAMSITDGTPCYIPILQIN
jgi:hypothetical protein